MDGFLLTVVCMVFSYLIFMQLYKFVLLAVGGMVFSYLICMQLYKFVKWLYRPAKPPRLSRKTHGKIEIKVIESTSQVKSGEKARVVVKTCDEYGNPVSSEDLQISALKTLLVASFVTKQHLFDWSTCENKSIYITPMVQMDTYEVQCIPLIAGKRLLKILLNKELDQSQKTVEINVTSSSLKKIDGEMVSSEIYVNVPQTLRLKAFDRFANIIPFNDTRRQFNFLSNVRSVNSNNKLEIGALDGSANCAVTFASAGQHCVRLLLKDCTENKVRKARTEQDEAIEKLRERLQQIKEANEKPQWLEVIVGAGRHSQGKQKIKPKVEEFLNREKRQWNLPEYEELNEGSLLLTFKTYNGPQPCVGYYYCTECTNSWCSKYSWVGKYQCCYRFQRNNGISWCYPMKHGGLKREGNRKRNLTGSLQPVDHHYQDLCQMCQELGRSCISVN